MSSLTTTPNLPASEDILGALIRARDEGRAAVLATIIKSRGSVPRHSGSKMIIFDDRSTLGSVGGGELEARVLDEAAIALREEENRIVAYKLIDPAEGDPGICGGEVQVYLEPQLPRPTLLLIGCGHVGRAVAALGSWLGYRVVAADDRPEMIGREHIPSAELFLNSDLEKSLSEFDFGLNTYVVATTRSAVVDASYLPIIAGRSARYIGVIGSRRRWAETRRLLMARGVATEDLEKMRSPVGLKIGAETPEEIALSIMSEITSLRHGTNPDAGPTRIEVQGRVEEARDISIK